MPTREADKGDRLLLTFEGAGYIPDMKTFTKTLQTRFPACR